MNRPIKIDQRTLDFRKDNGLALDEEYKTVWMATLGPLELPLPNWRWRRDIIAKHDEHHQLTGFDTSAKGELLVASWELGGKVYADWRARALCAALTLLGLLRYPRETLTAYRLGASTRAG